VYSILLMHAARTSIPSGQASSSARRPHAYGSQCGEECKTQSQTLRQVRSLGRRPVSDWSAGGVALHNRWLSLQQFHRPGVVSSVAFDAEARGDRLLTAEEQQAIVERAFAVDKTRFVGQRRSGNRSRSAVVRTRKRYQGSL
jgi:pyridoxal biosynthesis lyase PdxS